MPETLSPPYTVENLPYGDNLRPTKKYPNGTYGRLLTSEEMAMWEYVKGLQSERKASRRIGVLRYPPGDVVLGDGSTRSNADIARELIETLGKDGTPEQFAQIVLARQLPPDEWTFEVVEADEVRAEPVIVEAAAGADVRTPEKPGKGGRRK